MKYKVKAYRASPFDTKFIQIKTMEHRMVTLMPNDTVDVEHSCSPQWCKVLAIDGIGVEPSHQQYIKVSDLEQVADRLPNDDREVVV
jgi:hypothetical protein